MNKEQIISEIKSNLEQFDKIQNKYKLNTPDAFFLLVGTVAQESNFKYKRQLIKTKDGFKEAGAGCSYFQIEAETCIDVINNYIKYRKELLKIMEEISNIEFSLNYNIYKDNIQQELLNNFKFATFIARLCYYRQNFKFINKNKEEYAKIWKKYYNTELGSGTEEQFIKNYLNYNIDKIIY